MSLGAASESRRFLCVLILGILGAFPIASIGTALAFPPGVSLTSSDFRSAQPPTSSAVPTKDVQRRYGQYANDALQKIPALKVAIDRADASFLIPPGDLAVPNGPSSDNQAVRIGDREILLMSGCRLMHQCDVESYVMAYDTSSRTVALIRQTNVEHNYLIFGAPDPTLRALLLAVAAPQFGEAVGPAEPPSATYEGTYRSGSNEIKLLRVDAAHAKVDVYAESYKHNSGFATGNATVDKNGATYTDNEFGQCTIRLDFAPGNKLNVTQHEAGGGGCGFGMGVLADGVYTKVSAARPTVGVDPRAPAPPAHVAAYPPASKAADSCYDGSGPVACPSDDEFVCAVDGCVWRVPPGAGCDSPGDCIHHRAGGSGGSAPLSSGAASHAPRRSATFLPPPVLGQVFTVFEYKNPGQPAATNVALVWGGWRRQGVVTPPQAGARGFVVRLRHVNPDSVSLTFTTDGSVAAGPSQGAPPPAWTAPGYQQVLW